MKKAFMAAAVAVLLLAGTPLFAQSQGYATTAYYKAVPILKIWMHPLGYLVQFYSSKLKVQQIYVPFTWFNQGVNSKAQIVYGSDNAYPYVSIYWVDGKFDHLTLYVRSDYTSSTWGVLEAATDRSSQFNVQDVPLDF
jgi:hypothetical protein